MNARFITATLLVTLTGFIALSYEICWIRLYSFASGSLAWVFGAMLGTYLIGLAFGSLWSLKFQDAKDGSNPKHLRALSWFVLGANVFGFLLIPIVARIIPPVSGVTSSMGWLFAHIPYLVTLPLVGIAAALLGATLPLICHYAIPPTSEAGAKLSYLYLANILGSGAGSLLTGFVLMDIMPLSRICQVLLLLGLALSLGVAYFSRQAGVRLWIQASATLALGLLLIGGTPYLFDSLYERLQWKHSYEKKGPFKLVVESRFGVISVDQKDRIYGGGVYDGKLYTDLEPGSGMIRPYFVSAVHEAPKEVLVIGLSGGGWTQILLNNPHVERVTAVEINAAYAEKVIPQFDSVKSILDNPKLEIVTDDGRRWLRMNPGRKFDVVVANSTFHFREHATNLLSQEFMEQIKSHLNPHGIYMFNTTGSSRAMLTAAEVFPDVHLLQNNIVGSPDPIVVNEARWREVLEAYTIDGKPVLDLETEKGRADLEGILALLDNRDVLSLDWHDTYLSKETLLKRRKYDYPKSLPTEAQRVITDDNLGHEFPHLPTVRWASFQ